MQKNVALDFFKILLAAMVVAIHSEVFNNSHFLVDGLFRIAVPIFFIMNGYFFFLKVNSIKSLASWSKRVLLIYVFWMIFYLPFYVTKISGVGWNYFQNLFITLFFGYGHLWYIPAMLLGGGLVYFLRYLNTYFSLAVFILLFVIGYTIEWVRIFNSNSRVLESLNFISQYWLYRNGLFVGVPFIGLGYLIAKHSLINLKGLKLIYLMLIVSLVGLFVESDFINKNIYHGSMFHVDILFSLIFLCPCVFLIVLQLDCNSNSLLMKSIPLLASGIYFIHPFFISIFRKMLPGSNNLIFILSFTLSLSLTFFVIRHIKKAALVL